MVYLFLGTAAVWLGLFAYLLSLGRRQARLEQELARLRDRDGGA